MFGFSSVISFKNNNFMNYYASFSRGYKSGGINQEPNLSDLNRSYEPEYAHNFEIGAKALKKSLRIQLNFFYNQRKNQQISISSQQNLNDPNSFLFYTANAARGNITGIEFETKYQYENFEFGSDLGILKTWLDEFKYEFGSGSILLSGNREAAMSPKWSGSLYFLKYFNDNFFMKITNSYKSKYYFSDNHNFQSSDYNLINILLVYSFQNIDINFWLKNITNEIYETRGFYFALKPYGDDELFTSYGEPRQIGIGFNYNF